MIYFDNSATTSIDKNVLQTFEKISQTIDGNPSSLHQLGNYADGLLQQSRKQIADLLHVLPEEIYFTSGGTEGDNWAIKGTSIEKRQFGNHIITTAIEHPAVKESVAQMKMLGFDVTILPVDSNGTVSVSDLKEALRSDTILVSIMAVNNEVGSVQPIVEIGEVLRQHPTVHFHVDAVQAIGKISLLLGEESRIDLATFSAHKFHGPKGSGFMYIKKGKKVAPLLNGGGQELGKRGGTENVAGAAAMAKALRLLLEKAEEKKQNQKEIKTYLMTQLEGYKKVSIFSQKEGAPHILCFALKGIRGEVMVHAFEKKEIYISTTSACSSRNGAASSTLVAMNVPGKLATSAVRISLTDTNTLEEAKIFMEEFSHLYQQFKNIK